MYSLAEKLFANKPYEEPASEVMGLKVEFRPLSGSDEDDVVRSSSSNTFVELLQTRKIPTLARAIRSIDGVDIRDFDQIKQRLRSIPEHARMDPASPEARRLLAQAVEAELKMPEYTEDVITALYAAYSAFDERRRAAHDRLKKTSAPPNPATAG